jgi:hypothetical protein
MEPQTPKSGRSNHGTNMGLAVSTLIDDRARLTSSRKNKVLIFCPKGHPPSEVGLYHRERSKNPTGCLYCSNQKTLAGYNDIATTHPEIAALILNVNPTTIGAGSRKKVIFLCPKGHPPTEARIDSRVGAGANCPYCSGRRPVPGVSDIATTHPEIAAFLLGVDPTLVSSRSNKKISVRLSRGHSCSCLGKGSGPNKRWQTSDMSILCGGSV